MPGIRIQGFGGTSPRVSPRLLPTYGATVAQSCKLESGEIRSYRRPKIITTGYGGAVHYRALFRYGTQTYAWPDEASVVLGVDAQGDSLGRMYVSWGGVDVARVYELNADYSIAGFRGLLVPIAPPTPAVTVTGTGVGTPQLVNYLVTAVNSYNEEGSPSPPSVSVNLASGQTAAVSVFAAVGKWTYNFYRLSLGTTDSRYLFAGSVLSVRNSGDPPISVGINDIADAALGEMLRTRNWESVPAGVAGFLAHPGGFLVGHKGNKLYMSEVNQWHAWVMKNVLQFESNIVAVGIYGTTLVVATELYIHTVAGNVPGAMSVDRLPDPYPCVSRRSMVSVDRGVIFASSAGLVWVGYSGVEIITRSVMSRDEWRLYYPESMHGAAYDGKYVGFYAGAEPVTGPKAGGFMFDYADRATGADSRASLVTLGFYASTAYASPGKQLSYISRYSGPGGVPTNNLEEWDSVTDPYFGDNLYYGYAWGSKHFTSPYITQLRAAKVVGNYRYGQYVLFQLWIANKLVFSRPVYSSRPFRLPQTNRYTEPWWVFVQFNGGEGSAEVQEIHVATSMEELNERGGLT